jgi:hypothetical protein
VAETTARSPRAVDGRIRLLAATYGEIARRYEELESLSRREHDLLVVGGAMSEVHSILERKRDVLSRIRADEESVSETKTWRTRARRALPPAETRELLDVLDAVSQRIERALALESDCRALLARSPALRAGAAPSGSPR